MKGSDGHKLILQYIYLASGCAGLGVLTTFIVLTITRYYDIDIFENLWILAIPVVSSLFLNILFIELFRKIKGK